MLPVCHSAGGAQRANFLKTNQLFIALAAILVALTAEAQPQPPATSLPPHVEGELLVKFDGGSRGEAAELGRRRMNHEVKRHFDFIGWQQIRLPQGMTVEEGLVRYRNLPGVLAVEPNGAGALMEPAPVTPSFRPAGEPVPVVPNDPLFPQQWGLAMIGASNAWAVTTGDTNVVVAILDTGVNYNHEDLRANMWRNPGEIPANHIHLMKGRGVNIRAINLTYWSDFSFQGMREAHEQIAALGILQISIARPTPVDHDVTPVVKLKAGQ